MYLFNIHYLCTNIPTILSSRLIYFSFFFYEFHFFFSVFWKSCLGSFYEGFLALFPKKKGAGNDFFCTRRWLDASILQNRLIEIAQLQICKTLLQTVRHFSNPHTWTSGYRHILQIEGWINAEVFQMEEIDAGF